MEDDDCMIDEPEGLNPGPEPLSPPHKRSRSDSEVMPSAQYNHARYYRSALFALSNVLLTNTIAAIKSSPFYISDIGYQHGRPCARICTVF